MGKKSLNSRLSVQTIVIPLCVNTKCTYYVLMSKIYIYLHVMLLQHFVYCLPLKINKLDQKNVCSLHRNIHQPIHHDRMQ